MSLNRASSRKKFSITPEDLSACLDQKNSMIAVLQAEVEDLRINHEKYERMREEVHRTRERYESLIREYQISKVSNHERLQLTAKNYMEAKVQLEHLEKELQIKSSQLKDNKAESQQLAEHNNRREDDVAEVQIKCEELRGANELLRMEQDRSKSQIALARQQADTQRKQNSNINKSLETIKDKCHKTQSYMRSLAREQATLNEQLAKVEDENNYLDTHISELNNVQSLASEEVSLAEKQIQENKFLISSKQLELKRCLKEAKEASRNLTIQKQRSKALFEQGEQKKFALNRMQSEVRECSEQINYILNKNNEVTDVNEQLRNDLKVCEKHLENVLRVNKNMEQELVKYHDINSVTIKKLQEPMRDVSNTGSSAAQHNRVMGKWSTASRMTATGTAFTVQN